MYVRISSERSFRKSQWFSFSTSATPHRYSRPLTVRPSAVVTSAVEPMIENGIASDGTRACSALTSSSDSTGGW